MSDSAEAAAAKPLRGGRALWVLAALLIGIVAGALARAMGDGIREPALQLAALVGGLWLDALKMTVIPLIVALLVTGIAKGAEAARAGRIAARAIAWFVIVYVLSAVIGGLGMPLLLDLFPPGEAAAAALRNGLAAINPGDAASAVPSFADFFRSVVPPNIFAAASEGAVLQLVLFAVIFGLATSQLDRAKRAILVGFFDAVADAMLVVIRWVLLLAPVGVLGLAFVVGASAGGAVLPGLVHYILLVSALGFVMLIVGAMIAVLAGRLSLPAFARAMIGPQALAISSQSSLACLPPMLGAARLLGVRQSTADVVLPLSVALLRGTGPAMNIGVAIYIAHLLGVELGAAALLAGILLASVVSAGSVSLPGQASFITSIAPIAIAMGVPIAPLALLVAVEVLPDIMRTLGNVTLDVGVTAAVDRRGLGPEDAEPA